MATRIAIIIERADIALGGAERSMFEVASELSSRGVQVDLLAAKGEAQAANVHILCPDVRGKRVDLSVFHDALRRHLARTDYDVIHSVLPFDFADIYQPRGGTYAESILRHAASYPNAFIRCAKRAAAFANRRRAALLRAERRLCRGSSGPIVAALSRYVADQLKRHYGTSPNRIVLTLNGVNVDRPVDVNEAGRLRARILSDLAAAGTHAPVLFLFAAHNFRLKGLLPLLKAFRIADKERGKRPAGLIVAGGGKSDGYRRLAKRLGIDRNIVFLGPIAHVQDALSATDVAVLPTFYDPSSRFILEALAAGKPVITTRFNGATDHFTDGRHGTVLDSPQDIRSLATAISSLADAANVEKASRAIAQDNLREHISIRRVADELLSLYTSICEKKRHA